MAAASQSVVGPNQQWKGHEVQSGQSVAAKIANQGVSKTFLSSVQTARPGDVISTTNGRVITVGGGNVITAGGAN